MAREVILVYPDLISIWQANPLQIQSIYDYWRAFKIFVECLLVGRVVLFEELYKSLQLVQYWRFFEDDEQINRFLQVVKEFAETHIDQGNQNME